MPPLIFISAHMIWAFHGQNHGQKQGGIGRGDTVIDYRNFGAYAYLVCTQYHLYDSLYVASELSGHDLKDLQRQAALSSSTTCTIYTLHSVQGRKG